MKKYWYKFISLFMYRDWITHKKCWNTGNCQEHEWLQGTKWKDVDTCEDGCVWGKACWKFKKIKLVENDFAKKRNIT